MAQNFRPTQFLRTTPVTLLLAVHGIAFFAWLLLFIAQTILARTGNLALHRRLGAWWVILAAAIVVVGYRTTVAMGRRSYNLSGDLGGTGSDQLAGMAFPLLDVFMFAALFRPRTSIGIVPLYTSVSSCWH